MMEMPAPLKDRPEKILRRLGFTVSYNKTTKTPNYVAWHLVKSHTYGKYQRDEQLFMPDEDVPSPRATDNDYYGSRLDRGHMCPAADNKWSSEALRQSFLLSNICPQNHGLNKDSWNDLEMQCRRWAREYGAIDVVCGPIFKNKTSPRMIGTNKVWVPDAFFKVVLCRKGKPKAIGFIYENRGGSQRMIDTSCTVAEVALISSPCWPTMWRVAWRQRAVWPIRDCLARDALGTSSFISHTNLQRLKKCNSESLDFIIPTENRNFAIQNIFDKTIKA